MTAHSGHYSIIQFLPEPMRQEGVNVGVVLLLPNTGIHVRFAARNEQVKNRFHATSYDETRLDFEKRGLGRRLAAVSPTVDALELFAASEAGSLRILPSQPVRVDDAEATLSVLFNALVDDPIKRKRRSRSDGPDLSVHLAPVAARLERDVRVEIPYSHERFRADYGFTNGVHNLIKAWDFGKRSSIVHRASEIGSRGLLLHAKRDHRDIGYHLLVVGEVPQSAIPEVRGVLREHKVDFYTLDDIGGLVTRVRETAH